MQRRTCRESKHTHRSEPCAKKLNLIFTNRKLYNSKNQTTFFGQGDDRVLESESILDDSTAHKLHALSTLMSMREAL